MLPSLPPSLQIRSPLTRSRGRLMRYFFPPMRAHPDPGARLEEGGVVSFLGTRGSEHIASA